MRNILISQAVEDIVMFMEEYDSYTEQDKEEWTEHIDNDVQNVYDTINNIYIDDTENYLQSLQEKALSSIYEVALIDDIF